MNQIDLEQIYPFLAGISFLCRTTKACPQHPAILHRIINAPNPIPWGAAEHIPGTGDKAILVRLGDPIPEQQGNTLNWWPMAASINVCGKLYRRIMLEGWAFHTHFATAFALLDQFCAYGEFRLRCRTSPISDFGLAHGSFRATEENQLAYILLDGTVRRGQNPNDHWWIWFKTARGEELILDFGTFTWNLAVMVHVANHMKGTPLVWAPATFINRNLAGVPGIEILYTEDRRLSVLRDPELGHLATNNPGILPVEGLVDWAERRALGRRFAVEERSFMLEWMDIMNCGVQKALNDGDRKKWPAQATALPEPDPLERLRAAMRGF